MAVGITILVLYAGVYGFLRASGHLVRIENRSSTPKHEIVARHGEWDDIFVGVSESKPIADVHAKVHQHLPGVLNFLFWPLRNAESGLWRMLAKTANQSMPQTGTSRPDQH